MTDKQFKPTLGLFDATAVGLGAIIGGGIFVVTGIVAGLAGPALVLSIIIAGAISLFTTLSYVELIAWQPVEGGVYEYAHQLVSPFAGFLTGWMWIVSNTFAGAAVALGFAHYLVALFPVLNFRLVATVLCIAFTILNYLGIKHSAMLNNLLVLAKMAILSLFILVGIFHLKSANFTPFIKSGVGIFQGAFFIFFAFSGFGRVAVIAEEVKEPRKTVPRSITLALTISAITYILVGTIALGLVGAGVLGKSNSPLADAIRVVGNPALVYLVSIGGMMATASVLLTSILGVSRMIFAMARRNDLPLTLSNLHQKYNTPYISILLVGAITIILVLFFDLTGVVAVSTFASLFYYSLVNISALKLKSHTKNYRKLLSAIGLLSCLILLVFVYPRTLVLGVASLLIGALYYFGKGIFKKSTS
jgi:basic amino acid/polyamine antiporter, APA family